MFAASPNLEEGGELWTCRLCRSTVCEWDNMAYNWVCSNCGSDQLYDALQPTFLETDRGTWTYIPRSSSTPITAANTMKGLRRAVGPPHPSGAGNGSETAESEPLTVDPSVTPSTSEAEAPKMSRRQRRSAKLSKQIALDSRKPTVGTEYDSNVIRELRQLLKEKRDQMLHHGLP